MLSAMDFLRARSLVIRLAARLSIPLACLLASCGASASGSDADAVDAGVHVEPGPGAPGGLCGSGVSCAAGTERVGARCAACGALGERPCTTGCREGMPRYGVCFDTSAEPGTLGGLCHLEDCTPGSCSVPDGLDFVCFACGEAQGQPCCPSVGCLGGVLQCTDGVCH